MLRFDYIYNLILCFYIPFILALTSKSDQFSPNVLEKISPLNFPGSDIKCIMCDIDGTLTSGSEHKIDDQSISMIQRTISNGFLFFPATGRSRFSMNLVTRGAIAEIFGGLSKTPGVYLQGLMVYGPGGNLIYENTLPELVITKVVDFCDQRSLSVVAYSGDDIYRKEKCVETDKIETIEKLKPIDYSVGLDKLYNDQIKVHKMILMTTDEIIAEIRPLLQTELQGIASITQAVPGMLEVLPFGSSKGDGVLKLLNHIGVSPENTAAFGDGENDIEMFQSVRYGIAVDNAKPLLKKAARYLTDSNADLGVANALRVLIDAVKIKMDLL